MTERRSPRRLSTGLLQRLKGTATEIQIESFLGPMDEKTRVAVVQAVARLQGIDNAEIAVQYL